MLCVSLSFRFGLRTYHLSGQTKTWYYATTFSYIQQNLTQNIQTVTELRWS